MENAKISENDAVLKTLNMVSFSRSILVFSRFHQLTICNYLVNIYDISVDNYKLIRHLGTDSIRDI